MVAPRRPDRRYGLRVNVWDAILVMNGQEATGLQ